MQGRDIPRLQWWKSISLPQRGRAMHRNTAQSIQEAKARRSRIDQQKDSRRHHNCQAASIAVTAVLATLCPYKREPEKLCERISSDWTMRQDIGEVTVQI